MPEAYNILTISTHGDVLKTLTTPSTDKPKQLWKIFDQIFPSSGRNSYARPRDVKSTGDIYSPIPGKAGDMADDTSRVSQLLGAISCHQFCLRYFKHSKDNINDLIEGVCFAGTYRFGMQKNLLDKISAPQ